MMIAYHPWHPAAKLTAENAVSALSAALGGDQYEYEVLSITAVPPSVYNRDKGATWVAVARAVPTVSTGSSAYTRVSEVYFQDGVARSGNSTMC